MGSPSGLFRLYPDTADKGGWTGVFYPDKDTKRLRYYSQFFNTAEMDSTFYNRFYSQMTKGTIIGMSRATPEKFKFSIKVPETITHVKRLDVNKRAMIFFEQFLDKISPLRTAKKLGAILFQLPVKKKEGLTIEALGLCMPVGRWQLAYLFKENQVDTSHDPSILRGCKYSSDLGLEI